MTTDVNANREPGDLRRKTVEENTEPGDLVIKDLGVASKKTQGSIGFVCDGGAPPFHLYCPK